MTNINQYKKGNKFTTDLFDDQKEYTFGVFYGSDGIAYDTFQEAQKKNPKDKIMCNIKELGGAIWADECVPVSKPATIK